MNATRYFSKRFRFKRLRESGQTLLLFVLFTFMLLLFVGLGIDMVFAYITRARLSKAVDAACLMGVRNYSSADFGNEAKDIARATFAANYPKSGRDVAAITPNVAFGSANNNITINVTAATTINTFFIRIMGALPGMPSWDTLPVSSSGQGTRPNLIMSLVLDRSGSMQDNGGAGALPGAVVNFINLFDDGLDRASMSSFSSGSTVDFAMNKPFKSAIKTNAQNMSFGGYTCSERGLTNGFAQNISMNPQPGEKVVRVMVFFTDGMANTWYHRFPGSCGGKTIDYGGGLHNPVTGADQSCSGQPPSTLPSINPQTGVLTANKVHTSGPQSCAEMHDEAQRRAERIAYLARAQGIIVYSIGLGDPNDPGECGGAYPVLNPAFLKKVANTSDSSTYNPNQPSGDYAIAANAGQIDQVFQAIGAKILSRLSR